MSIKTKLTILFMALTVIPLLFMAVITTSVFQRLQTDEILVKLDAISGIETKSVESYFAKSYEQLDYFSAYLTEDEEFKNYIASPSDDSRDALNESLSSSHGLLYGYNEVSIVDSEGVVLASTNLKNNDQDWSGSEKFIIGKSRTDVALFSEDYDNQIVNDLVSPIYIDEKFVGVVVIKKDLSEFSQLINDAVGLGDSGEILIANRDKNGKIRYLITPKYYDAQMIDPGIYDNPHLSMNIALSKVEGVFTDTVDYRNVPVFSATRFIEGSQIGLVAKVDRNEILASFFKLRDSIVALIAIVVTASLLLAYLTARNFSTPIKYLASAAENISNNNFSLTLNVGTNDEIGLLTKSFNEMSSKLSTSYQELDFKVKTKTKELSENVRDLEKLNKFMIDRELKMVELKKRIAELERK